MPLPDWRKQLQALNSHNASSYGLALCDALRFNRLEVRTLEPTGQADLDRLLFAILDCLDARFAYQPHPISTEARRAYELAVALLQDRLATLRPTLQSDSAAVVEIMVSQRMRFLARYLATEYLCFRDPTPGTWASVHQCLTDAIDHQVVTLDDGGTILPHPVLFAYLQIAILALANPYSFRPRHFYLFSRVASIHTHLARAQTRPPAQAIAHGLAYLPVRRDLPPIPSTRSADMDLGPACFLQLHDLTYALQAEAQALRDGGDIDAKIQTVLEQGSISKSEYADFLRRVLAELAATPERVSERKEVNDEVDIALGFFDCWSMLTDPAEGMRDRVRVVDQHVSGAALMVSQEASVQVSVGTMVLYRPDTTIGWCLADVRWIRNLQDRAEMMFGCRIIGYRVEAFTAQLSSDVGELPALIAQVPEGKGDSTILLPRDEFHLDEQIVLSTGLQDLPIVLTQAIEEFGDCVRYRFLEV